LSPPRRSCARRLWDSAIQALVFTLLTAVYIGLLCNHEGGDHGHEEGHGEAHH
jgi:hypothetical protein